MNRFEYLSVLLSIVIALGISEIVSSWGALLRHRREVRFYWVHTLWTVLVVLLMVQMWWGFWNYRTVEAWSFVALVAVVAQALVMVLAGLVLTAQPGRGEKLDLRRHYYDQSRVFFALGFVLLLQLAVVDATVGEQPFLHPENAVRGLGLGVAAWGAWSRSERAHEGIAVASALLIAAFVAVAFSR